MDKSIFKFLKFWFGENLPSEHIIIPKQSQNKFIEIRRRWLIQPIKRHLAKLYASLLCDLGGMEIIGITGSAGKTTTKEMVASILSKKYKVKYSFANIDPVYNIPATILSSAPDVEKLVLEMGIEFPGEMDFYLWLVKPKVGIITNIYWTHTQFLGDIKGVLKEKGKLIKSLPQEGYAILNYEDKMLKSLGKKIKAKVIWYGESPNLEIRSENIEITEKLTTRFILRVGEKLEEINLKLLGQQFVSLALAASCVGVINDMDLKDIKRGLEKVKPQPHRMVVNKLADETVIIDDTYNANPLATIESLKVLSKIAKKNRKIFVFGEMKELGKYEERGHKEVGKFAFKSGIDCIFSFGNATAHTLKEFSKKDKGKIFLAKTKEELIDKILEIKRPGDFILVKGSRSLRMEEVVEQIK